MTSSLVGSEMCIRDSPLAHNTSTASQYSTSMRPAPVAWVSNGSNGAWTVSYTHLTLPTICSV
eukprot:1070200-Prorocentrum_lima.AAC.1